MPSYELKSRYGYARTLEIGGTDIFLPGSALAGAGIISGAAALNIAANITTLTGVSLTGAGVVTGTSPTLTANLVSLAAASVVGAGVVTAGSMVTTRWLPSDLGSKLKLWLPYSGNYRFQDIARTTLCTTAVPGTTDLVASWQDISGNGKHAEQSTSGLRPKFRTNGGVEFVGSKYMSCAALGAWTGDFDIIIAAKVSTYVISARYVDMDSVNGYLLSAANNAPGPNLVNSILADPTPPYGLEVACTDGAVHKFADSRVGTSHTLRIDGSVAGTETVSAAALTNATFYVATAAAAVGAYCIIGDEYEIVVAAGLTTLERTYLHNWVAANTYT